jgi:hypothetical protein
MPYCYAAADASDTAALTANLLTSKLADVAFVALNLVHAIDQAIDEAMQQIPVVSQQDLSQARVQAQLRSHLPACDVLVSLLSAALTCPNRASPFPLIFIDANGEKDITALVRLLQRNNTMCHV